MHISKLSLIEELLKVSKFSTNLNNVKETITDLKVIPTYPIILIGGTNGKGSTCNYLGTMLKLAGYKVGKFTSPHILEYNERITINNLPINDDMLINNLEYINTYSKQKFGQSLGLFATFTVAAHKIFMEQKVDIAIIEVGIGGRLDPTNLFEPTISAITNIDYDHAEVLGSTLEEIGLEKVYIFRNKKPCFFGDSNVPNSVVEYAKQNNVPLQIFNVDYGFTKSELSFDVWCTDGKYHTLPFPALRGEEQLKNASLALAILNKIKIQFPLSLSTIKTGLLQSQLIGRFQILPGTPQIILDVAHNPHAVSHMLKNMLKLPFAKHNVAIFGVARDKDVEEIIRLSANRFDKWFIAPIKSAAFVDTDFLINTLIRNGVAKENIHHFDNLKNAYKKALTMITSEDRMVCFGSFLVVEEIYKLVEDINAAKLF